MNNQKKSPFKRINKIHDEIALYIKKIEKLIEGKKLLNYNYSTMVNNKLSNLNRNQYNFLRYENIKMKGNEAKYGPRWYEQIPIIGRIISLFKNFGAEYYGGGPGPRANGETFERYHFKWGLIFLPLNFLCLGTLIYPVYFQRLLGGRDSLKMIYEIYANPINPTPVQINNFK